MDARRAARRSPVPACRSRPLRFWLRPDVVGVEGRRALRLSLLWTRPVRALDHRCGQRVAMVRGETLRAQVGFANASDGASFIWTPSSLEKIPPGSAIELDPGSGFVTSLRFVPILDDEKRSEVCAVFEKQDREKLATEIQRQMTPQIAGALPPGGRACRSGSVWNLVPEEGS